MVITSHLLSFSLSSYYSYYYPSSRQLSESRRGAPIVSTKSPHLSIANNSSIAECITERKTIQT